MSTEAAIVLADVKMHLTMHRPGYGTERKSVNSWPEINAWIVLLGAKRDYPYGSVLRVHDWTGTERFLVRGGAKEPPRLVKLSEAVRGLPSNPDKKLPLPAVPSIDFTLG